MTFDEFLAWEREQPERYEYAGGVATMVTGGSLDHSTIASNLHRAVSAMLRGSGCMSFRGDAKVIANGNVQYPDLSVTCQRVSGRDDIVPEPVVVIEVLSPSTAHLDRGRKKLDYFATPSVRHYVIIEQDERLVDLYTRDGERWTNQIVAGDGAVPLSALGIELPLDAIYEDTDLDPTRRPEAERRAPAS